MSHPRNDFPLSLYQTKVEGLETKFNLMDLEERKEYFHAKVGAEITALQEYFTNNTFIAYWLGKKNSGKGTYSKLMMEIFGKKYSKTEILKKVGDVSQLGGIKSYEFSDGMAKNLRAVDIKSPNGIEMTVVLDRAMDISALSYKNIPISWRSATREASAAYYESKGLEWLRTFFGGLMTTCGLTYFGPPANDNGEELGLHGRITNLPAGNVFADGKWENDNYVMWVQGKIREARPFGEKLELSRKISTFMDKPVIIIEDTVENIGFTDYPLMVLYHLNFGFPLLDSSTKIVLPKSVTMFPIAAK